MLKQLFNFVLSSFTSCINVFKSFTLDNGITFYHVLIFFIFIRILIFVIEFIKHIQVITNEDKGGFKK